MKEFNDIGSFPKLSPKEIQYRGQILTDFLLQVRHPGAAGLFAAGRPDHFLQIIHIDRRHKDMQVLLHKFPALFVFRTFEKDTEFAAQYWRLISASIFSNKRQAVTRSFPPAVRISFPASFFRSSYIAVICRLFIPPPPSPLPFFPVTLFASASTC